MSDVRQWIDKYTIFKAVVGSRAYGINTPESDYDYRGVAIAPKEYYLGLHNFEQLESKDPDSTIFDIKKFFKLAVDCNPNIIEFLYVPEDSIVENSNEWRSLLAVRDEFLSKRAKHRYTGYAMSQLKRIKSHRSWLLNPPTVKPERVTYGLPAQEKLSPELTGAIDKVIRDVIQDELMILFDNHASEFSETSIRYAFEFDVKLAMSQAFADFVLPNSIRNLELKPELSSEIGTKFFSDEVMEVYEKEKKYRSALNHWNQYQSWVKQRNPKRAELERKHGFDTKHAGHTFRLLIQGEEILKDHTLTVRLRPEDREYVMAVKDGAYNFDQIMEAAETRMANMETLYNTSTLRHSPDFNKINDILVDLIERYHFE